MKKFITITLCGTLVLSLAACKASSLLKEKETVNIITNRYSIEIPNPFIKYNTLQEVETSVGFKVIVPTKFPAGYVQTDIFTIENDIIEITYLKGENKICFRQAKGVSDISGDYNEYNEIKTILIGGLEVTTKGNNHKVNVVTWRDGIYTFAISIDSLGEGLENNTIIDMIESIK